jgi:hypothetical protein
MLYNGTATDVLTKRPVCDMCGNRPAAIDGKVKYATAWAYMCIPCWEQHGVGLGVGLGQRLLIDP